MIIPADAHSPSASAVGVVDFIDEWISAPYARQQQDRAADSGGPRWIDGEAQRRYSKAFAALSGAEHAAICEQICYAPEVSAALAEAAEFFARYRDLTAAGFYTSPAGRKDLQYVGNVALATFEGPPREALAGSGTRGNQLAVGCWMSVDGFRWLPSAGSEPHPHSRLCSQFFEL